MLVEIDNYFNPLTKHNEKCSSEKQYSQQCSYQSSTSTQQTSAKQPSVQTLNSNIIAKSAAIAEIIWELKPVLSEYSNHVMTFQTPS